MFNQSYWHRAERNRAYPQKIPSCDRGVEGTDGFDRPGVGFMYSVDGRGVCYM